MKIINCFGKDDLAKVYVAEFGGDKVIEFVESLQPPILRHEKWVLIISTSFGCPVGCLICDASGNYNGRLTAEEIFQQIDFLVLNRYPDRNIPAKKFKIQFARMGEPSFNNDVLAVLNELPDRYTAPGLMPCLSTIAPLGTEQFFEELLTIKNNKYNNGRFQLQFSIHSTAEKERDHLMPGPKWPLAKIAEYGERFYKPEDRKITLNFALARGFSLDPKVMIKIFSPDYFMIKITPVNPTLRAVENGLESYISPYDIYLPYEIVEQLRQQNYDTLISIGENEENLIGSNCGQYVTKYFAEKKSVTNSYSLKYLNPAKH